MKIKKFQLLSIVAASLLINVSAFAQSGTNLKAGSLEPITTILLCLGSVIGIIGAIRVYS
jgi:energy-converting hydrogenase Eha subunit C